MIVVRSNVQAGVACDQLRSLNRRCWLQSVHLSLSGAWNIDGAMVELGDRGPSPASAMPVMLLTWTDWWSQAPAAYSGWPGAQGETSGVHRSTGGHFGGAAGVDQHQARWLASEAVARLCPPQVAGLVLHARSPRGPSAMYAHRGRGGRLLQHHGILWCRMALAHSAEHHRALYRDYRMENRRSEKKGTSFALFATNQIN